MGDKKKKAVKKRCCEKFIKSGDHCSKCPLTSGKKAKKKERKKKD